MPTVERAASSDPVAPPRPSEGGARVAGAVAWLPLAVAVATVPALLVWRAALGREVFALSYDDFLRVAHATDVGVDRLFPSDLWPPLPFWLTSAALQLAPDTRVTPGLVNFGAATVAALLMPVAARALGLGVWGSVSAVLLVVAAPWWRWLSFSALAEPVVFAPMLLAGVGVAWTARPPADRPPWVPAAVLTASLVVGGLARYELWGFAAWAAALLLPAVRRRVGLGDAPVPSAALVLATAVFPASWLVLQAQWNADPVFFATIAWENAQHDAAELIAPGAVLRDVTLGAGPVALIAAASWRSWWRRDDPAMRAFAAFAIGCVALQVVAQLLGLAGAHNTTRHYVALSPCLAMLAGRVVDEAVTARRAWVTAALPAALVASNVLAGPTPDAVEPEVATIAARVRTIRTGGALAPADRVMIEAVPWDCFALAHAVGAPSAIEWDRNPFAIEPGAPDTVASRLSNPSIWAQSSAEVLNDLRIRSVGLLVTRTPRGEEWAAKVATRVDSAGGWTLWRARR